MKKLSLALLIFGALSGSAVAQGDPRFCGSYAANASTMGGAAIKKNPACVDFSRGVHGNYQSHFDWCMKNPAGSVRGAEANIRRLVSECTGNAQRPASKPTPAAAPRFVAGEQEPFGQNIGAWTFTQQPHQSARVVCRAKAPAPGGVNVIGRYGNGKYYLGTPIYGLNKRIYEESTLIVGAEEDIVVLKTDGRETFIEISEPDIPRIIKARGWGWRVARDGGRLQTEKALLDTNVAAVIARLRECTKANGGQ